MPTRHKTQTRQFVFAFEVLDNVRGVSKQAHSHFLYVGIPTLVSQCLYKAERTYALRRTSIRQESFTQNYMSDPIKLVKGKRTESGHLD